MEEQKPTPGLELAYNQLVANKLFKYDDVTFEEFNNFINESPDNLIDIKNRLETVNDDISSMSIPEFQRSLFGDNQVDQSQSHLMNGVAKSDTAADNIPSVQFDTGVPEAAKGLFTPEYLQQLKGSSSKTRNLGGLLEDDVDKNADARISKGLFDGYYKVSFPDGTATEAYLPQLDSKLGANDKTGFNSTVNAAIIATGLFGQGVGSAVGLASEVLDFFIPGREFNSENIFENSVVNAFQDLGKSTIQRKSSDEHKKFKEEQESRQRDPNLPDDRGVVETVEDIGSDLLFALQGFKHPEFYEQDVASGVGSVLGFMVPGRAASKLTESTIKTALPKLVEQFPKLSKFLANEKLVEKTAGLVVGSSVMTGLESAVEAQGIFDEANEYFQTQGVSKEESRKRAGEYANEGFGLNFQSLMVSNAMELISLGGYMKGVTGIVGGTALGGFSEGVEELQQFGIGEYTSRYREEGYNSKDVGFLNNWGKATKGALSESIKGLTSGNPDAINSFILGTLLGGPSAAMSSTADAINYYTVEKPFKRDYHSLLSDGASDLIKRDKDGKIIFNENNQISIDGDRAASHLKAVQMFSSLHDAQTFFASQNKEDAARFYMGAKLGELVYNYKQKGLTDDQIRDVVGKDYGKQDYENSPASKLLSYDELKTMGMDFVKTASENHDSLIKSGKYNNNSTSYFQQLFRNKNNISNITKAEDNLLNKVSQLTSIENRTIPQESELQEVQANLNEVQKTKKILLAEETKLFNEREKDEKRIKANTIISKKQENNKTKEEVIEEVKRENPDMVESVKEVYQKQEEFVSKMNELEFSMRMNSASSEEEIRILVDQHREVIPNVETKANEIYKNKVETQRNQQGKISEPEDILTRYGSENKVLKGFELGKIRDIFRGKLTTRSKSRKLLEDMINYANGKHVDPKKVASFLEKNADLYKIIESSGVTTLGELTDLPNLAKNTIEGLLSSVPELSSSVTEYGAKDFAPQDLKFEKSVNETIIDNETNDNLSVAPFNVSGQPTITSSDLIHVGGIVDVEIESPDGSKSTSKMTFAQFVKLHTRSTKDSIIRLIRPIFGSKGMIMYVRNTPEGKKQWENGLKILRSGILHQGSIIYYEVDSQVEWNTMGRYTPNDINIHVAVYTKDGKVVTRDTVGAIKSVIGQIPSTSHSQEFHSIRQILWTNMEKDGFIKDGKITGDVYKGLATRTKEVFSGHLNVNKGSARSIKSFMSKMKKNQVFFGYSKKDNFGTVSFSIVDPLNRVMPITVNSSTPGAIYMFVEDENGKIHPNRLFTKSIKNVTGAKNAILNILEGFKNGAFDDQLRQLHEYVRFRSAESKFSQYTDIDGNIWGIEPYFKVDKKTGLFTKVIPYTEEAFNHAMKVTGGSNARKGTLNKKEVIYIENITPIQLYDLLELDEKPIQVDMKKVGDASYMDTLDERVFSDVADPETGSFEGIEYSTASHSYSVSIDPTYYEDTSTTPATTGGRGKLGRLGQEQATTSKRVVLITDNTDSVEWFKKRFEEIGIFVDDVTLENLAKIHKMGGSKIWGVVKDAAVVLASDASNEVTRHEAFHIVFRLFLNDTQRSKILDEAFNKWGNELGIKERSHTTQEVAFKLGGTAYYETLDADSKLEEKLAREFETYKHNTQVMSDEWHAKYPKISKFFEELYNFFFDEYDKLKQIFNISPDIDTLFRRIERDTLGRTLVTDKRRKSVSRLIAKNKSEYSDKVAFSIDGYSNIDVRESAKFINKDILSYILSEDKYANKTLVELLQDRPTIVAKRELLDEIYSKVPDAIDEYKGDAETYTGSDLTDIYEGIKTLFKHPDFKKALYRDLSSSRNVAVSLDQLTSIEEGVLEEERPKESWQVDNIRVNPIEGLSAELLEFLQDMSRVQSISDEYVSDTSDGKQKQIYRRVTNYKFTKFGGLQYYDVKQIHTSLLNELSDSANDEDMFNRLVDMAKRHDWVNILLGEMNRLGDPQYDSVESRIRSSSMFKRMYMNIGSYTNIDPLMVSEDPTNKVFNLIHLNSNKVKKAKARHYISLFKMGPSFVGDAFNGNFYIGDTIVGDIQIEQHLNEITTPDELNDTLKAFGIEPNEFIADKILNNAKDLGIIKKSLINIATSLEKGHTEYEALKKMYENINAVLNKYEVSTGQMSFLNVNGEKQYAHIKGGTMNRIMSTLKTMFKDAFISKRKTMIFHKDHPFYDDLSNDSFIKNFNLQVLSGLSKDNSGVSFDFSKYNPVQLSLTNISVYFNELLKSENSRGRFAVPPLGDSPTHLYVTGTVFTIQQIEDKLVLLYKAELNRIAYLKANPSEIKNYSKNGLQLIFFKESKGFNLPTDNSLNDSEIKIEIRKMMNIRFNKYMKKLEKQGLFSESINEDTGERILTPNSALLDRRSWNNEKDNNAVTLAIQDNLRKYYFNQFYYNTGIISVFSGDPAFYKDPVDFAKRFKQIYAPGDYLFVDKSQSIKVLPVKDIELFTENLELIEKAIDRFDQKIKDSIISKFGVNPKSIPSSLSNDPIAVKIKSGNATAKEHTDFYNKYKDQGVNGSNNITDGQSFQTLSFRKRILQAQQKWTDKHEQAWDNLQKGLSIPEDIRLVLGEALQPQKPFYFDFTETGNTLIPIQMKDSQTILLPGVVYRTKDGYKVPTDDTDFSIYEKPELAKALYTAEKTNSDLISFDSTIKIGLHNVNNFSELSPEAELGFINIPMSGFKIQNNVPEHYKDYKSLIGTQLVALINADPNATSYTIGGKEYSADVVRFLFEETISYDLNEAIGELSPKIRNTETLRKLLIKEALRKRLDDQYIDALRKQDGKEFMVDLYDPMHSYLVESFINSMYKKTIRQKVHGGNLVNVSSVGYEDLEIKIDDNGNIEYVEVAIPAYSMFLTKLADENGIIDLNSLPDKVKNMVGYRIPTEGKYSMFPIKIKHVLPAESGGTIIMPRHITTIAGLDFDIDKMYMLFYALEPVGHDYNEVITSPSIESIPDSLPLSESFEYDEQFEKDVFDDSFELDESIRSQVVLVVRELISPKGVKVVDSANITSENKLDPESTKKERNNLRMDLMFEVLGKSSSDMFNSGNSDILDEATDMLLSSGQQIENDSNLIIGEPSDMESLSMRSAVGGRLIGVFANENKNHALIQRRSNVKLKHGLLVRDSDNILSDHSQISPDDNGNISKVLASLLFASTEHVKNPKLDKVGINEFNVGVVTLLTRLNVPFNTIVAFINQPIIKELNENYYQFKQEGKMFELYEQDKFKDLIVPGYIMKQANSLVLNTTQLMTFKSNPSHTLSLFKYLSESAAEMTEFTLLLKPDSGNLGPTLSEVDDYIRRIRRFDPSSLTGTSGLIPEISIVMNNTGYSYEISKPSTIDMINSYMNVILSEVNDNVEHFPYFSPFFQQVKAMVENIMLKEGRYLDVNDIKYINNQILNYFTLKDYSNKQIGKLLNKETGIARRFTDLSATKYPTLKSVLTIAMDKDTLRLPIIRMADTGSLNPDEIGDIKSEFEDLIFSADPIERQTGIDLAMFAIYSKGKTFGFGSYSHLIPSTFYTSTPEGIAVQKSISKESISSYVSLHKMSNIVDKILLNSLNRFAPQLFKKEYVVKGNILTVHSNKVGKVITRKADINIPFHSIIKYIKTIDTFTDPNTQMVIKIIKYYQAEKEDIDPQDDVVYHRINPRGIPGYLFDYSDELIIQYPSFEKEETVEKTPDLLQNQIEDALMTIPVQQGDVIESEPTKIFNLEDLGITIPTKENQVSKINFYTGRIKPEPNTIFVFGSNPEGRHGAGAAKAAVDQFGAIYGQGEGLQGSSYALPTKDLRVTENGGFKSISPEQIIENIKKLYEVARQNPNKQFKIAYTNTTEKSLNGYTGLEMIDMFNQAGEVPTNILFSEEWKNTDRLENNSTVDNVDPALDNDIKPCS